MPDSSFSGDLVDARRAFEAFTRLCSTGHDDYRLTPRAEPSAYARCFGIYCQTLSRQPFAPASQTVLADAVRSAVRQARTSQGPRRRDKAFRQLLAFSLSALAALKALDDPLADLVEEQIPTDVRAELKALGCLDGRPGSGNQAMFLAVFLLHARDFLGANVQPQIDDWIDLHLERMNQSGFWGPDRGRTHLQFQNGYHQYEILEYLGVQNPKAAQARAMVQALADPDGHFAPYPGGGACYDYDAVFVLTPNGRIPNEDTRSLLQHTASTLMKEQRPDGGFAESLSVRPRSLVNAARFASHIARSTPHPQLFIERLRYGLALQRPRHDRMHTHWSVYSRRWNESDLWDSWFRMLTLARIQVALDPANLSEWGFIDYPGIGYHAGLRKRALAS